MSRVLQVIIGIVALGLFGGYGPAQASGDLPSSAGTEHKFAGAKKCKNCHKKEEIGNQYKVWEESGHAKAMESLSSDDAKKWAKEAGIADPTTAKECVACHQTAYDAPVELKSEKFKPELGVQCESCHGAGKDFAKKKVMIDRDAALAKGLTAEPKEACVSCHNDKSPAWDPERYTTADGKKAGFDFDAAFEKIAHPVPEGYDPNAKDVE